MYRTYVPDFLVRIAGLTLEADVSGAVLDLTCDSSLSSAGMFSIQLNNANSRFTDSALFDVGKTVEIYMGYAGELQPMILGEITAISPSFPQSGAPTLTITGYDKSHRMRHNKPDRFTFKYSNDSVIAAQIAVENGLIPIVDPALMPPRESVQQTGSDWALLKELADRNFFEVYVQWDKLRFGLPRPQTELVVLEWGRNLLSFAPRLSTSGQYGIQVIRGYDYKLAQTIVAVLPALALGADLDGLIERLGSTFVNQLASLGRNVVRDSSVETQLDAVVLAKTVLQQLLQGLYEGSGRCVGLPMLRAGEQIEIQGIGKRFSGRYTLSKVTHTINEGGYQTQFEVSQAYDHSLLNSLRQKITETPPPHRQEKQFGVVIGRVQNNVDPEGLGRVQLTLPMLSDQNLSKWARVVTPLAGASSGLYFLPELNQEVLVAFEQGDINRPIVLGSLWNGQERPPESNNGGNPKKVLRMRSGLELIFDETPSQETLTLQDGKGSLIKLDAATGDVVITAKRNVVISSGASGAVDLNDAMVKLNQANGNIDITADKNVTIKSGAGGFIDLNP